MKCELIILVVGEFLELDPFNVMFGPSIQVTRGGGASFLDDNDSRADLRERDV